MKQLFFSSVLAILVNFSGISQTKNNNEINEITKTVMLYIDGTENGNPEKVRTAFEPNFSLFLTRKDTLAKIEGKGYIDRIQKGKKYNRIGKIIAIDYENDAASVKVDVYFPDRNRVATDYLLLLKINDTWKILHKIINLKTLDKADHKKISNKNEIHLINRTLLDYIEGTANGKPNRIKEAFHKDFNLYYIKSQALSIIDGQKYISNFKQGKKNNRIGKVLSVDYEGNAALAKIEVLMPNRNRIAIDYLLLLKIKGKWKIIHKSFTSKKHDN